MKNKAQISRFAVVGLVNTVIDFGLLFLLTFLDFLFIISIFSNLKIILNDCLFSIKLRLIYYQIFYKLAANPVSTGLAFIFSFFANKKYTFKSTSNNIMYEIILFIIITLFGLWVLQNSIIWLATPPIKNIILQEQLALFIAKLLATIVSLVWNYCLYDKFVFKKESL